MNMKKVIQLFGPIIVYLLIVCTILSSWIEKQMMTRVKIVEKTGKASSFSFPESVLFSNEEGSHFYEVVEGTGWNTGLRVKEIDESYWNLDHDGRVNYSGSVRKYRFVISASRIPQEGREVFVVENFAKCSDQYLCIFEHGLPDQITLPENMKLISQTENTLLLEVSNASLPFFEHAVKAQSDTLCQAERIISCSDANEFREALKQLVRGVICFLLGIILLSLSVLARIYLNRNKLSGCLFAVVLFGLCLGAHLLQTVEFPPSMLPAENIFDFDHYSKQIEWIVQYAAGMQRTLPSKW